MLQHSPYPFDETFSISVLVFQVFLPPTVKYVLPSTVSQCVCVCVRACVMMCSRQQPVKRYFMGGDWCQVMLTKLATIATPNKANNHCYAIRLPLCG